MRLTWLADEARAAGLGVIEYPGWQGYGRALTAVQGVVVHDTVTPGWRDVDVARLLRNGRPDLSGPLSQLGVDSNEAARVISDGRANHNGYGEWGNESIGIEVFCAGGVKVNPQRWSDGQYDTTARLTAAILRRLGLGNDRCALGHKETDPRRKIDPWGITMTQFRAAVGLHMLTQAGWPSSPRVVVPTTYRSTHHLLEDTVQRIELTTGLDDMGRGWTLLNGQDGRPEVPWGTLISVEPQGSAPERDGYWPIPEVSQQQDGSNTRIAIEGGIPGGSCLLYLHTADIA